MIETRPKGLFGGRGGMLKMYDRRGRERGAQFSSLPVENC
jgi:hypothetical protein